MGHTRVLQPYNTIFVGNLPYDLTEDEIKNLFTHKEDIIRTYFPSNKGKMKGHGFITFKTTEECEEAIKEIHCKVINNRTVVARWADHRKPKDDPNQEVTFESASDYDDDYDYGSRDRDSRHTKRKRGRRDRDHDRDRDRDRDRGRDRDRDRDRDRKSSSRRRSIDDDYYSRSPSPKKKRGSGSTGQAASPPPGYNPMLFYWMNMSNYRLPPGVTPPQGVPGVPPMAVPGMPNMPQGVPSSMSNLPIPPNMHPGFPFLPPGVPVPPGAQQLPIQQGIGGLQTIPQNQQQQALSGLPPLPPPPPTIGTTVTTNPSTAPTIPTQSSTQNQIQPTEPIKFLQNSSNLPKMQTIQEPPSKLTDPLASQNSTSEMNDFSFSPPPAPSLNVTPKSSHNSLTQSLKGDEITNKLGGIDMSSSSSDNNE